MRPNTDSLMRSPLFRSTALEVINHIPAGRFPNTRSVHEKNLLRFKLLADPFNEYFVILAFQKSEQFIQHRGIALKALYHRHAWDANMKERQMCIDKLQWTTEGPRCEPTDTAQPVP